MIFDLPLNTSVLSGTNVDARLTDLLRGHCSSPDVRANVLYIGTHFYGEVDDSHIKYCTEDHITLERYTLIVINQHGSYYNNGVVTSTLSDNYCTALGTLASLSIPFLCVIS
jgi:hypothetical protein